MATGHWLVTIMHDLYPTGWKTFLDKGIVAQHHTSESHKGRRNLVALRNIEAGDRVVAAFKQHHFAGYGTLRSGLKENGPPLELCRAFTEQADEFNQQFDCDWTATSLNDDGWLVDCHSLKNKGFDVDLMRGMSVKWINKATFLAIKRCLDKAGAKPVRPRREE